MADISELEMVAFYGALFAIAASDGVLDRDEVDVLFELLDLSDFSLAGRRAVLSFAANPPNLAECLEDLKSSELRFALYMNLIEVVGADEVVAEEELDDLELTRGLFGISDEQHLAMLDATKQVKEARGLGLSGDALRTVVDSSAATMAGVGVPLTAIYFAGITGFSAAGISSGLAAVALGAGMIPGIGLAITAGVGLFAGVSFVLGRGRNRNAKEERSALASRISDTIAYVQGAHDEAVDRRDGLLDVPDVHGEISMELKYLGKLIQVLGNQLAQLRSRLKASV